MIQIERHPEEGHVLTTSQMIHRDIDDVFGFFSDAFQLERITPPFLKFRVLTPRPIELHEGALIDYSLVLRLLPIRWRTEISVWEPSKRFVDQQLRGPYRKWHHEHTFEAVDGGTMVYDKVHYIVPFKSNLLHRLFVKQDLIKIFEHRHKQLDLILNQNREPVALPALASTA